MSDISRRGFLITSAGVGLAALLPVPVAQAAGTGTIAITYQRQKEQNWCSAASSRIALSATGRTPTQKSLAKGLGLGPVGGHGLLDPYAIARVLNNRLGLKDATYKYHLRQDMGAFDDAIQLAMTLNKPVVYNVIKVGNQSYSASGHYICITGRRKTGPKSVQYRIADPDSPARTGNWYDRSAVKSWNKYGRYTSFGQPS